MKIKFPNLCAVVSFVLFFISISIMYFVISKEKNQYGICGLLSCIIMNSVLLYEKVMKGHNKGIEKITASCEC